MKLLLLSLCLISACGCATPPTRPTTESVNQSGNEMIGVYTILKTDRYLIPHIKTAIARKCLAIGCHKFSLKVMEYNSEDRLNVHYECLTDSEES